MVGGVKSAKAGSPVRVALPFVLDRMQLQSPSLSGVSRAHIKQARPAVDVDYRQVCQSWIDPCQQSNTALTGADQSQRREGRCNSFGDKKNCALLARRGLPAISCTVGGQPATRWSGVAESRRLRGSSRRQKGPTHVLWHDA